MFGNKEMNDDDIPSKTSSLSSKNLSMARPTAEETAQAAATNVQGGSSVRMVVPLLMSSLSLSLSHYNVEEEICEIWLDNPGAGVQALLDELILRRNLRRRRRQQLLLEQDDVSSCSSHALFPAAPTKKRIQQAKALIPYRRIIQNETGEIDDATFDKQDFVQQALERRNKCKTLKQWDEVNRITDGLQAMGIELDDRYKTWRVLVSTLLPVKKEEAELTTTLPLFNGNNKEGDARSSPTTTAVITCEMCGRSFASRNLVFQHLRDVTSGCGTSIWQEGKSVVEPPSVDKKLERRERLRQEKLERNQRRRSRAATAVTASNFNNNNAQQGAVLAAVAGDQIEASLWVGDLPLAWTKPSLVKTKGGSSNYKRLSQLLYRYNLPNTPLPWIKSVVRKAYHCKNTPPPTAAANHQQQQDQQQDQQNGHLSGKHQDDGNDGRRDHYHGPYLGYAIVVYRSADEAAAAREYLDGLKVASMESTVYGNNNTNSASTTTDKNKKDSDDLILPSFTLVVRPARKSSTNSNNDSSCANANKNGFTTNDARHYVLPPPPGLDPPLADQLQPLTDDELRLRVLALKKIRRHQSTTSSAVEKNDDSNHHHDIDDDPELMEDNDENGIAKMNNMKHDKLVAMAVAEYQLLSRAGHETRPVRRYQGRLIPIPLRDCLLNLLENLLWPAQHQRPMLTSERYLVLVTSTSATPHYKELREACQQLMQWADPTYYYSGIAVTKNFIASPHVDERDQSFQYALSLGNFNSSSSVDDDSGGGGGELCVEGKSSKSPPRNGANEVDNKCDDDDTFVNVVNTHNRIARVDGRRVHWVRTWTGGDRYSLIFYDTTDRNTTSVMEGGVDLDYLSAVG